MSEVQRAKISDSKTPTHVGLVPSNSQFSFTGNKVIQLKAV